MMKATKLNPALSAVTAALAALAFASPAPAAQAPVRGQAAAATPPAAKPPATATLQGCITSSQQTERSVTFAGEMNAQKGAPKMEMRVDVLERLPKDLVFHSVFAPGLGVWRTAAPGVSNFKYLKEITNLAAPASYRAVIRFRWLSARGHVEKLLELRTPRCVQTLSGKPKPSGSEEAAPGAAGTTGTSTAGTGTAGAQAR